MAKDDGKRTVHRSSETGKFVTEETAKRHPKTTETERVKNPPKKKWIFASLYL